MDCTSGQEDGGVMAESQGQKEEQRHLKLPRKTGAKKRRQIGIGSKWHHKKRVMTFLNTNLLHCINSTLHLKVMTTVLFQMGGRE